MEFTRDQIIEEIYASLRELNEQLSSEERLPESPQTPLLVDGAGLDSLGFVNFVALLEEKCQGRFGKSLVLSDATEKLGVRDPFETIGTLAEYIELGLKDRLTAWR